MWDVSCALAPCLVWVSAVRGTKRHDEENKIKPPDTKYRQQIQRICIIIFPIQVAIKSDTHLDD